ncbi:MAG: hypothetical protein OFPII_29930 [Osedax symbiont Rs1]|nr:MAG: hypothetical protein OFPII_29930 [Osedax symbiont Rs1]
MYIDTYIGQCELRPISQHNLRYQVQTVVFANHIKHYTSIISQALSELDFQLVWTEDITTIDEYLAKVPQPELRIRQLADNVNNENPVCLGPISLVEADNAKALAPLIKVTEHRLQGIVNDSEFISPSDEEDLSRDILGLLFGTQEATLQEEQLAAKKEETLPALKTYAILNADHYFKQGYYLQSSLERYELNHKALLKGEYPLSEQLKMPYLVDISLPNVTSDVDHRTLKPFITDVHKTLFGEMWGNGAGIFIRSRMPFDNMWQHVRTFYYQKDQVGAGRFFFYFHPSIAARWFPAITENKSRVDPWFYPRNQYPISAYIYETTNNDVHNNDFFMQSAEALPVQEEHQQAIDFCAPLRVLQLGADTPTLGSARARPYLFEDQDRQLFIKQAQMISYQRLLNLLKKQLPNILAVNQCSDDDMLELIQGVRSWADRLGFTSQAHLAQLVINSVLLGINFYQDAKFLLICKSFANQEIPPSSRIKLLEQSLTAWAKKIAATPPKEQNLQLADIVGQLGEEALGINERLVIISDAYQKQISIIGTDAINAFYHRCSEHIKNKVGHHDLTPVYALCALNFGIDFISDPQHKVLANCFTQTNSENHQQVYLKLKRVLIARHQIAQEVY